MQIPILFLYFLICVTTTESSIKQLDDQLYFFLHYGIILNPRLASWKDDKNDKTVNLRSVLYHLTVISFSNKSIKLLFINFFHYFSLQDNFMRKHLIPTALSKCDKANEIFFTFWLLASTVPICRWVLACIDKGGLKFKMAKRQWTQYLTFGGLVVLKYSANPSNDGYQLPNCWDSSMLAATDSISINIVYISWLSDRQWVIFFFFEIVI